MFSKQKAENALSVTLCYVFIRSVLHTRTCGKAPHKLCGTQSLPLSLTPSHSSVSPRYLRQKYFQAQYLHLCQDITALPFRHKEQKNDPKVRNRTLDLHRPRHSYLATQNGLRTQDEAYVLSARLAIHTSTHRPQISP